MAQLTKNRTGRPLGSKDKKKRRPKADTKAAAKQRSDAAKKAATTRAKLKAEKAAKLQAERPPVEKSDVQMTPYPRAGDNPEFQAFINEAKAQADRQDDRRDPGQRQAPGELLQVKDVAEWCAWPFMVWAQSQNIKTLMLTDAEANDLAEPLTNILNRHGVADIVSPDVLDALKFAARATPVMTDRFGQIKRERQKRAGKGVPENQGGGDKGVSPPAQGASIPQGTTLHQPKEV